MELVGWTNDRLVAERLARLPVGEWVHGRANSSIILAAFLHAPVSGARFSGPDLGAWYAAATINTAVAEVAHHLRRETLARALSGMTRTYRAYHCRIAGDYLDLRGQQSTQPALYASADYAASQVFGEAERASGGDGLVYDSLRHAGGINVAAYRPSKIVDVAQGAHLRIAVQAESARITVTPLEA